MQKIIVAIDGYAGCGKSSTAKAVASQLGYMYIDSGAMYRAVTLFFIRNQVDVNSREAVALALAQIDLSFQKNNDNGRYEIYLNGEAVESAIRDMKVAGQVSAVSALKPVRQQMVALQQAMGQNKGIVMDGRDIGTVVFPQAELKIFMTASIQVRAQRRKLELSEKGVEVPLAEIEENLVQRDLQDTTRQESPLVKAHDSVEVDTSGLKFEEQVATIVKYAHERIQG
jgi:cytidylate kinase